MPISFGTFEQYVPLAFLPLIIVAIFGAALFWGRREMRRNGRDAKARDIERRVKEEFWNSVAQTNRDRLTPGILNTYARTGWPISEAHATYPWLAHHIERMEMGKRTEFGK